MIPDANTRITTAHIKQHIPRKAGQMRHNPHFFALFNYCKNIYINIFLFQFSVFYLMGNIVIFRGNYVSGCTNQKKTDEKDSSACVLAELPFRRNLLLFTAYQLQRMCNSRYALTFIEACF